MKKMGNVIGVFYMESMIFLEELFEKSPDSQRKNLVSKIHYYDSDESEDDMLYYK
jgi:hypothetical protein